MADSSRLTANVVTSATDSSGSQVISVVQTDNIESSVVTANIVTGGVSSSGGGGGAVDSVNGQTGIVVLTQDSVGDGTTYKQYSSTEKTKLSGVASGATANDTDANLKNRANHTGTQTASTISDFSTAADARVAAASGVSIQPIDSDLTTIAAIAPTNDDIIQRKAGAWTNRTMAQVKTDLALVKGDVGLGNVDNTSDATKNAASATLTNKDLTSGTNTFPTLNQNTTGSAAKWTTARNIAGNSVDGSANATFANKFIVQGTTDAGLTAAQFLGSLGTGIVKNTTTTGVLSIAAAGTDYQAPIALTTTGTSGAATLISNTLNIPQYSAGGGGDASTNTASSVDGEITLFSGTAGKTLKRATGSGMAKLTSGVLSTGTAGTDYTTPSSTETQTNKTLTAPKFANAGFIADANGNEQLIFNASASAVNEISIQNAATGFAPSISASGGDTNITLYAQGKGSGSVVIADGASKQIVEGTGVASAVNYTVVSNSATGNAVSQTATGTDTNISINLVPKGTGRLQSAGVTVPTISSTDTMTNKRVTKRTGTATSSATPTINTDNVDFYSLTAQAADITSFTTNLSGTPTTGQTLWIAITGTAARAITWGASFEASTVALPTTTVTTNRLDVGFIWTGSIWRCVAAA